MGFKVPSFLYIKNYCAPVFLAVLFCACDSGNYQKISDDGKTVSKSGFTGSEACMSCHETEYASWKGSHHEQAMKIADSTSVLGDFNNVEYESNKLKSLFFMKGKDYFVNTEGPDGKYHDYKIEYTFGVTPLQQYIVEFPNGKYQCLQTAWDVKQGKWFDLQPNLEIKHTEWLHWSRGGMRWNSMCADCHSTNLHKNFDSKTRTYNTTYSEISVGCEACHGPSSLHVDHYRDPEMGTVPPKMYMDTSLSSKNLVGKCARCHSRRSQITKSFTYEGHFLDHYSPSLLVDPLYELDGQIKDEVYVYGSFVQSKMYQNGVSCRDCHDVHSLKLKKTGNKLCLNCHNPNYDSTDHHFHKINSEAALCINCHMVGKYYMGNDFRRDHGFRVPRPDQTVKYGTPNACNGCHKDKTALWARGFIISKYGLERKDHFSDHLLAGNQGNPDAYHKLFTNSEYPEIVRATAINRYAEQQLTLDEKNDLHVFLKDSSALVRNEAVYAYERMQDEALSNYIATLLTDSIRLVRISAAKYINVMGVDTKNHLNFDKAREEYLQSLDINSDFASGQHQIALYQENKRNIDLAIEAYRRAIEIDNYYNASKMNLALLLYRKGDVKGAEQLYLKVTEQEPDFGYSYYMLGLLYHETGDSEKALSFLSEACNKKPENIRAFYNYALKLQEAGQMEESVKVMDEALKLFPDNEQLLYVKLIGELNSDRFFLAYDTCLKLIEIAPNNTDYKQILTKINESRASSGIK